MNNREAYNIWAEQYDTNNNRTRDLEAIALRETLNHISFETVLEIGCGTGKNTGWLVTKSAGIVAVDFSEEMLGKARAKNAGLNVEFIQADITNEWKFTDDTFDLITFSLVLEHIKDIDFIFTEARRKIKEGCYLYVGELHPFKQYTGTLARFDTAGGRVELQCFIHHISEFFAVANSHGFSLVNLNEWFDDNEMITTPRVLTLLFKAI